MITAIVDMGSNTIRLCVYEYGIDDNIKSIINKKTMAGLINFIENEKLSQKGMDRACEVLNEYKNILNYFQLPEQDIHVFATASLRNIKNTMEVIEYIQQNTGYLIELLSGEEEATLDFVGATKVFKEEEGILVDIGGGSTEIVAFKDKKVLYATSMPIGSLNMYVKHVKKIIPKEEERKHIINEVLSNLKTLELPFELGKTICGVGGSIRAAAKLNNNIYNLPGINICVETSHIEEILLLLNNSKKKSLAPVLQNVPDRIHTIIPGLIILNTIANYFNTEHIIVSPYGVREGYLYERIIKRES